MSEQPLSRGGHHSEGGKVTDSLLFQSSADDAAGSPGLGLHRPARPRLTLVHGPQEESKAAEVASPAVEDGWPWVHCGLENVAPRDSDEFRAAVDAHHLDGPDHSSAECLVVQQSAEGGGSAAALAEPQQRHVREDEMEDAWWAQDGGHGEQEHRESLRPESPPLMTHADASPGMAEVHGSSLEHGGLESTVAASADTAAGNPPRPEGAALGKSTLVPNVPPSIGRGRLVPARPTWKPGDPFGASGGDQRFRWELLLTSAGMTAACGMGAIWLLRSFLA